MDQQISVIVAVAEGSSIRAIERMTAIHRDTIMRLGVRIGQGCTALLDVKMRNLSCNNDPDNPRRSVTKSPSRIP